MKIALIIYGIYCVAVTVFTCIGYRLFKKKLKTQKDKEVECEKIRKNVLYGIE